MNGHEISVSLASESAANGSIASRSERARPWLLLAGLLIGLTVVITIWLSIDRRPAEWDHANHLKRAVDCYRTLSEPGHDRLKEILETSSFYPPIAPCAAGMLYFVFPIVPLTANVSIGVGALSYAGQLNLVVIGDRDLCPDLDVFVDGVRRSLEALERRVVPAPS